MAHCEFLIANNSNLFVTLNEFIISRKIHTERWLSMFVNYNRQNCWGRCLINCWNEFEIDNFMLFHMIHKTLFPKMCPPRSSCPSIFASNFKHRKKRGEFSFDNSTYISFDRSDLDVTGRTTVAAVSLHGTFHHLAETFLGAVDQGEREIFFFFRTSAMGRKIGGPQSRPDARTERIDADGRRRVLGRETCGLGVVLLFHCTARINRVKFGRRRFHWRFVDWRRLPGK